MSKCIGCGVKLQSIYPDALGYVPEIAQIEHGENVYCKRCYEIRHHNKVYLPSYNPEQYYEKIKIIQKENALVILMIDILDIYGGFIDKLDECIGKNKVFILVNKIDLLPKSINLSHLEAKIRNIAMQKKLHIEGMMLISATNQRMVQQVIQKISKLKYLPVKNKYQKERQCRFGNCYIVGCASVGKSTLMNTIGKITLKWKEDVITTSNQYQTTLDFIKWPLDNRSDLIDTPGVIRSNHFGEYLTNQSLQILIPNKYIKPRTYQLTSNQSIVLGGLARIDCISETKMNASFYVSNNLYLHRTKTLQVSKLWDNQFMKLLVPPYYLEEVEKLGDWVSYHYALHHPSDLWISGIGFVHFVGENCTIKLTISAKILVVFEESFM